MAAADPAAPLSDDADRRLCVPTLRQVCPWLGWRVNADSSASAMSRGADMSLLGGSCAPGVTSELHVNPEAGREDQDEAAAEPGTGRDAAEKCDFVELVSRDHQFFLGLQPQVIDERRQAAERNSVYEALEAEQAVTDEAA